MLKRGCPVGNLKELYMEKDKYFIKESREIYANKMKNITEPNPIIRSKLANQYWNEHLKRIEAKK